MITATAGEKSFSVLQEVNAEKLNEDSGVESKVVYNLPNTPCKG